MATNGNLTANATGASAVEVTVEKGNHPIGSFFTLYVTGTWGGGTVQMRSSPDRTVTNATSIPDVNLVADGQISFQYRGQSLWLDLSGATSPNLNWWVE